MVLRLARRPVFASPARASRWFAPQTGRRLMHVGHSHDTSALAESWDFENHGGLFDLGRAEEARAFFQQWGFVVMTDVMTEDENNGVLQGLVDDVHEINPNTWHIQDVAGFTEAQLPSSPNHSFRTTCNLVFGRFASLIRSNEGVRSAFGVMHGVPPERLGCSWDTIFYTSEAAKVTDNLATQLHWYSDCLLNAMVSLISLAGTIMAGAGARGWSLLSTSAFRESTMLRQPAWQHRHLPAALHRMRCGTSSPNPLPTHRRLATSSSTTCR